MSSEYNKYLHCILYYFVESDPEILITKIKPILNDPYNINYNYVQYDPRRRALNLFARLVELYVEDSSGQFYKCVWTVIHCVPLLMCENNPFVEEFYKSFIVNNVHCISCLMHYITIVSEFDEEVWVRPERLFVEMLNIHNEIKESKNMELMSEGAARAHYAKVIAPYEFY